MRILLDKAKYVFGCAGFMALSALGFALLVGGLNFIFDLILWVPSKFFGVFFSAAVLGSMSGILALSIGRTSSLGGLQQSIVLSAQGILVVVAFAFFVLLTESTVGRQTAQWALYTVVGIPIAGLFGALFDARWLAIMTLGAMALAGWLMVAATDSIESPEYSQRPIAVARGLALVVVAIAGVGLYLRAIESPAAQGSEIRFAQGRHSSVGINLREIGHQLKISFLGTKHSESIVSARRLYERMHARGFYSRSLPYIDAAVLMSEDKYGSLSPETLRHLVARLKVLLLKGQYEETNELVERILSDLDSGGRMLPGVKCGFKLELAGVFSSTGHQFDVARLMEGVFSDRDCPISRDLTFRLPAYIAYARGLIWEERYQEATAVLLVAAGEAAGVIRDESPLGIELLEAMADLSMKVGDPFGTLILEEWIWELVNNRAQEGNPRRAMADARLAAAMTNVGSYVEALVNLESAVPALERVFGASSPVLMRAKLIQVRALRNSDATQESVALAKRMLADGVAQFGNQDRFTSQARKEYIASLYAAGMFAALIEEGTRMLAQWPATDTDGTMTLLFREEAIEIAKYLSMSRAWSGDLPGAFAVAETVKLETSGFRKAGEIDPRFHASLELATIEEQIASAFAFPELRAHLENRRRDLVRANAVGRPVVDHNPFARSDPGILEAVLAALAENEAYASYLLTADGLGILFIVRNGEVHAHEIDVPYLHIADFHEYLINPQGQNDSARYDGSILTRALFPFSEDSDFDEFPERLVVSPDLWLRHLPFDALRFRNESLLGKSVISITSHGSGWLAARAGVRRPPSSARLMVVGNPRYGLGTDGAGDGIEAYESVSATAYRSALSTAAAGRASWTMLPGSEREIDAIKAIWDSGRLEIIAGADAHEALVTQALNATDRLDYVLFSTHGFSNLIEPEVSALVLAPHPNSTEAVSQLSAAKIRRLNLGAELVFLSACDTNSRPISSLLGPAGLPRAFSEAGARYIVSTLWPIRDDVAPEISIRFFEALLRGEPYADALADAKRQVSALKGSEHPYFWAGFMLYEGV